MLRKETESLVNEINGLKREVFSEMFAKDSSDLSEKDILVTMRLVRVIDKANNVMIKQAELLEDIDSKLNMFFAMNKDKS